FADQSTFDGEIRIEAGSAPPPPRFRMAPRRDRLFVETHNEGGAGGQRAIFRPPNAKTGAGDLPGSSHVLNFATENKLGDVQQRLFPISSIERKNISFFIKKPEPRFCLAVASSSPCRGQCLQ